jgi:hypothetical protein
MTTIPTTNIIIDNEADGYVLDRKFKAGRKVTIEFFGDFGAATIQPGYIASDVGDTFVADGTAITADGRFSLTVPESGYPAFAVTGGSGTAVKVDYAYSKS